MAENELVIREMRKDDAEPAADWAAQEGWNPGLNDAACFYYMDPHGFFVGELSGEPIGCISAASYGDSFGFIGFYIIRKGLRGKWYGVEFGRKAMSYLGDRNIGIDGVVGKIKNYEKCGFTLAHRNIRCQGRGGGSCFAGVVELATVPLDTVVSYDAIIFPVPRAAFLEQWIIQPDGAPLCFLEDMELKGYGVMCPCRTGFKIGPLFGGFFDMAERLFNGLTTGRVSTQTPVFLDVPASNPAALVLARRHDMTPVFETGRRYNKGIPAVPMEKVFGITSFELG